jgi:ABC-type glycerol-3-phosphate transport system substrate-binding protein
MNWMYVNQGASFPVRQSTWENDDFVSEVGEEFTSTSLESLQSAIGDPFDPQYPEWGQDYSEELQLAIAGDKSVEEAFTDAAAAAEDIAGQ